MAILGEGIIFIGQIIHMKLALTIELLIEAAKRFCLEESKHANKDLYRVTDGKAIGTYIEHKFQDFLSQTFTFHKGSSAKGIDFPDEHIQTDIKVTSIKQPQSFCPFRDAKQKIFGLGYHLLVFVYDKVDNPAQRIAKLDFVSCFFLDKQRTADYTTTYRLIQMVQDGAIQEDIFAYLNDKNMPADEITLNRLADAVLATPPRLGYLTISNALQWRLQYNRVALLRQPVNGIIKIVDKINKK